MKRYLAIGVLAMSVLGGCAATGTPAKAAEVSAKATEAPVKAATASGPDLSKEAAKTAFLKVVSDVMGSPDMTSFSKAVAAGDYKTVRELAPNLGAKCQDGPDEIKAVAWPAEIKDDMVTYAASMKDSCSQWADLAATSTDQEAKKVVDSAVTAAKSNQGAGAAAGKRIVAYLGLGA